MAYCCEDVIRAEMHKDDDDMVRELIRIDTAFGRYIKPVTHVVVHDEPAEGVTK